MVSDCQGQGKGKTEYLTNFLQVAVDVVDCRVVLSPLFLRVFGGDDRKEVGSVGTGIFVYDFLQVRVPDNVLFLACYFGDISQVVSFDVVFCQVKQVTAGHAICEDGEKEDVTGENGGGVKVAYVHIA